MKRPRFIARAVLVVIVLAVAVATPAVAGVASVNCPAAAPRSGDTFVSDVTIDAGTKPLGAYTFNITYEKTVVSIASIAGGTTNEFTGAPITNSSTFTSGMTGISAFNAASITSPTGLVSVGRVTFNALGSAGSSSALGLQIIKPH